MKILPFQGILYNNKKVNPNDVITLPYDKISPEQKSLYQSRSPYNVVNLILPKNHNEAAGLFQQWINDGILAKDSTQSIYVYEQEYEYPKGVKKTRRGFVGLLELQPFGKDTVMPHERTFSKVVKDRMDLIATTHANFEHIFILHSAINTSSLHSDDLRVNFKDEFGITHKLYAVSDKAIINDLQAKMKDAKLFIADGHHRYEASLLYKEEQKTKLGSKYTGKEGFNYRMVTFVDVESKGLTILPTHRVLKSVPGLDNKKFISQLEKYFTIKKEPINKVNAPHSIGIYLGENNYYTATLKDNIALDKILGNSRPRTWLYLDVNILHLLILKYIMGIETDNMAKETNILYFREEEEAIDMVKNNKARVAFLLKPTKIEEVKDIVSLGEVMPHKSTDFYPKLHSGLVMRSLDDKF